MQIKLFINKLERLMKEKYPQIKIDFLLLSSKKKIHIGDCYMIEGYFYFLNTRAL